MLLTRYTFVNTLEKIKPLVLDWAVPSPGKAGKAAAAQPPAGEAGTYLSSRFLQPTTQHAAAAAQPPAAPASAYFASHLYRAQPRSAAAGAPAAGAYSRAGAVAWTPLDARGSGAATGAASKKRNAFLARMSRRVARNMLLR